MRDRLVGDGRGCRFPVEVEAPSGHAVIAVDDAGENAIMVLAGANAQQDEEHIATALSKARPHDLLLLQNETTAQATAARMAQRQKMRVIYSAAPFDAAAVRAVLPHATLLAMNEGEAAQLVQSLGRAPDIGMLVTLGRRGARWQKGDEIVEVSAPAVEAVDTTAAGDTFIGYVAAALDEGQTMEGAMRLAAAAAALKVTRAGAADAIPAIEEVRAFLGRAAE